MISIYNNNLNLFMSPFADGPIKYTGEVVDDLKIENITKYGRNFSIIRIPYSLKLLIQELNTMNICMRIITEDNIDQLSSMAFSNVIENFDNPKIKSIKSFTPISLDNEQLDDKPSIEKQIEIEKTRTPQEEEEQEEKKQKENIESDTYLSGIGNKLEEYQADLFKTLTSKSKDIFSQTKDAILSIGKETTFNPDILENVEKSNNIEIDKPSIVLKSKENDNSQEELNESGDESSQNEFVIVGDQTTPDINEESKLPIITNVEKDKDTEKEEKEKEKEKEKIINI